MTASTLTQQLQKVVTSALKMQVDSIIEDILAPLPTAQQIPAERRRGIIARYTAVLEGNFIYWMTAALLSTRSSEARPIIMDNLLEEVRDSHPAMLRRFALAAHAYPTDEDALAVHEQLTRVRLFLGRLSGVQTLLMMAFFEGLIQRFMALLADLATAQGSTEMEYTDVHGVCDVAHSEGLFEALSAEMAVNPPPPGTDLFEGVYLLRALLENIFYHNQRQLAA